MAGLHTVQNDVMLAILLDSTVSGGFWEERNAKTITETITETIKIHEEWTESDCDRAEKIPNEGDKTKILQFPFFFSSRRGSFSGG
jgi:hypothetical protein